MREPRILDLHGPLGQNWVDELVEVVVGLQLVEVVDPGDGDEELLEHLVSDGRPADVDVVEQEPLGSVDDNLVPRIPLQPRKDILCFNIFHNQ